jgi:hypothetical protein
MDHLALAHGYQNPSDARVRVLRLDSRDGFMGGVPSALRSERGDANLAVLEAGEDEEER